MNFKTTLFLLVALVLVGTVVMFRHEKGETPPDTTAKKLLDVAPEAVTDLSITSADGTRLAMTKSDTGDWKMTQPVSASAEKFSVDDLVRSITSLQSQGQVASSIATGLDKPQYTIELKEGDKTQVVKVGNASAVGDTMYVDVDNSAKAYVVSASLIEQLQKPAKTYRQSKLVPETADQIEQLTLTQKGQTLALARDGQKWTIVAPTTMPADESAVNAMLDAVTGLRAEDFVTEGTDTTALGAPRMTISYSTELPSTQPAANSTTQPTTHPADSFTTVVVGRYTDLSKKNVLAYSPAVGAIVSVPATSLDALDKKPLDLRDKEVLSLDAHKISAIDLKIDSAATTQPTTKPASSTSIALARRPVPPPAPAGPAAPTTTTATNPATQATNAPGTTATTGPATVPATNPATAPATAPIVAPAPQSKWIVASDASKPASDAAVDALLRSLAPLKAEKFMETPPLVAVPVATYHLSLTVPANGPSLGEKYELRILNLGKDANPVVTYNGLTFEADKSLLVVLQADFEQKP